MLVLGEGGLVTGDGFQTVSLAVFLSTRILGVCTIS